MTIRVLLTTISCFRFQLSGFRFSFPFPPFPLAPSDNFRVPFLTSVIDSIFSVSIGPSENTIIIVVVVYSSIVSVTTCYWEYE